MEAIRIKTKEMLDAVEKAPSGSFLASVRNFVKFARQQPDSFDDILVEELEAQYQAFKAGGDFTGDAEYALICALWRRPTPKAVPALSKILVEDATAGREEIVRILRDVGDPRAVQSLLSVLETLDDEVDEGGHLRSGIAEALGAIGDPCALPALQRLEATPSADGKKIARYVKWAIEQLNQQIAKETDESQPR